MIVYMSTVGIFTQIASPGGLTISGNTTFASGTTLTVGTGGFTSTAGTTALGVTNFSGLATHNANLAVSGSNTLTVGGLSTLAAANISGNVSLTGANTFTVGTGTSTFGGVVALSGVGVTNTVRNGTAIGTTVNPAANSGTLYFDNTSDIVTSSRLYFINSPVSSAPSFTNRSDSTVIVLYPNIGASSVDTAIGQDNSSGNMWLSVPTTSGFIKLYGGTTNFASFGNSGSSFTSKLTVSNATAIPSATNTPTGAVASAGALALTGTNASTTTIQNAIMFNASGTAVPTATTGRTVGSRLVIHPVWTSTTLCDFAIGMASATSMFYGTSQASDTHAFYNGTALTLSISNTATTIASTNVVTINNTTASSAIGTAALVVLGGISSNAVSSFAKISMPNATNSFGIVFNTNSQIYSTGAAGVSTLDLTSNGGSGLHIANGGVVTIDSATASTSAATGALVLATGGVGVGGNSFFGGTLTVSGALSNPTLVDAGQTLLMYEDQTQAASTLTFAGPQSPTFVSGGQSGYIQMTNGTPGQTGYAYLQKDPGASWTCQFEYLYSSSGADAMTFFVAQTALPGAGANNGGYEIVFDEYSAVNKIFLLGPSHVTTGSSGVQSVTQSTYLTGDGTTYNKIIITCENGLIRLFCNDTLVPLTFATYQANPSGLGTYMGFSGNSGGLGNTRRIRNIRVRRGVTSFAPSFATPGLFNTPPSVNISSTLTVGTGASTFGGVVTINNATASTSTTTGALVLSTGGLGVVGTSYFGGALNVAGVSTFNAKTMVNATIFVSNTGNTTGNAGSLNINGDTCTTGAFFSTASNFGAGASPSFTTRTTGTVISLKAAIGASSTDAAIGIDNDQSSPWLGFPTLTGNTFKIYGGTTVVATFGGNALAIPSATNTPTSAFLSASALALTGTNASTTTIQNAIMFNASGTAVPTATTGRTVGSRLVIHPVWTSTTLCDFAIGMASATSMFYGTSQASDTHAFYNGTALTLSISNTATTIASTNVVTINNTTASSAIGTAALVVLGGISSNAVSSFAKISMPNATNSFGIVFNTNSQIYSTGAAGVSTLDLTSNGGSGLHILNGGVVTFDSTTSISAGGSQTASGAVVMNGCLAMNGVSGANSIIFNTSSNAQPGGSGVRSTGTRLCLWPGTTFDYAIGIGSSTMWFTTDAASGYEWYVGGTKIGSWNSSTMTISNALAVTGIATFNNTTPIPQNSLTPSGALNVSGGIAFKGTNGSVGALQNAIIFNASGVASPTITDRTLGTRLVLYPTIGTNCDFAIGIGVATPPGGISSNGNWYGVSGPTDIHMFYHSAALTMILANNNLYLGTSNSAAVKFTPIHSVTQTTSPVGSGGNTGFTTSGICGVLSVDANGLTVGSTRSFTMNNALITTSSIIMLTSGHDSFLAVGATPGSGTILITIRNVGTATGSTAINVNFFIIS